MAKREDIRYAVLVVSAAEQFPEAVKTLLPGGSFYAFDVKKSAAAARACILERYYDLIAISAPLPDETGLDFVLDITEQCSASILFALPREVSEDVSERLSERGILTMHKPLSKTSLGQALKFLLAIQKRMHGFREELQKAREKAEELRIVTKAKLFLMETRHMSEDEAHRFIGKQAMDQGLSRKRAAERILEGEL